MKSTSKFIVFHPFIHKPTTSSAFFYIVWLLILVLFFALTFTYILITTRDATTIVKSISTATKSTYQSKLRDHIFNSLVYYATTDNKATFANSTYRMAPDEVRSIAAVIQHCSDPCNILVFGFSHESLLWSSLNQKGRTVFIDENSYQVAKIEKMYHLEAYDVSFTTKVSELYHLIEYYKTEITGECKPVQNMLYSDCRLAVNDMPNELYDIAWDIIIIDGPAGYNAVTPGRMSTIFSAGVLARTNGARGGLNTHVFLHELDREVEQVCSEEFLCKENMVERIWSLGHFVIGKMEADNRFVFCHGSTAKLWDGRSFVDSNLA